MYYTIVSSSTLFIKYTSLRQYSLKIFKVLQSTFLKTFLHDTLTDIQTDTQIDRQTDIQTYIQTDR